MGIDRIKNDLTGKVFGRLTVIKFDRKEGRRIYWLCRCECGNEIAIRSDGLTSKNTKSCGCLQKEAARKNGFKNRVGERHGRLIIIKLVERPSHVKNKENYWECLCDCGNTIIANSSNLRSGNTVSCGCFHKECASNQGKKKWPHHKLEWGKAAFNRLLVTYKRNAANRNLSFELDEFQFEKLINQNCYYCNCEPGNVSRSHSETGNYIYNGIDRIDSSKGYTEENTVPCCTMCNRAKLAMPQEEFLLWIKRISDHQKSIGNELFI